MKPGRNEPSDGGFDGWPGSRAVYARRRCPRLLGDSIAGSAQVVGAVASLFLWETEFLWAAEEKTCL